jgi:hypothetical protein
VRVISERGDFDVHPRAHARDARPDRLHRRGSRRDGAAPGVDVPATRHVYALTKLLDRTTQRLARRNHA